MTNASVSLKFPKISIDANWRFSFSNFGTNTPLRASSFATISVNINSISMLNGKNFKGWKENILIIFCCMDLDFALWIEQPTPLRKESSPDDKRNFEKWARSNRMSLMIIKRRIPEAFRGADTEKVSNAKEFLVEIEKRFAKNDKAETSTPFAELNFNEL
ncbi:uncharacterized protein LOC111371998 [Olea europaea var. sylvestris]|uniref:uncharacterized protein LOC111371998 n=1 Tax=Olea europaea var. sylvestris TaxID=158386 RepID=UPI000C1CDF24|nr:uncharacterized protein LOC111371998 [Olea europaea var. sylvestris]